MLHKLRQRAGDESGFTLIELLVVILIIGILAAIALPSFLGQRTRAQDTEAKTQVRAAQTAMRTYYVDKQNYDGADDVALRAIEPTLSEGAAGATGGLTVVASGQTYTVTVKSVTTNTFSVVQPATGGVNRTCVANVAGGCKPTTGSSGTGTW